MDGLHLLSFYSSCRVRSDRRPPRSGPPSRPCTGSPHTCTETRTHSTWMSGRSSLPGGVPEHHSQAEAPVPLTLTLTLRPRRSCYKHYTTSGQTQPAHQNDPSDPLSRCVCSHGPFVSIVKPNHVNVNSTRAHPSTSHVNNHTHKVLGCSSSIFSHSLETTKPTEPRVQVHDRRGSTRCGFQRVISGCKCDLVDPVSSRMNKACSKDGGERSG